MENNITSTTIAVTTPNNSTTSVSTSDTTISTNITTSVKIKYNINYDVTVKLGNKTETLTKGNSSKTISYTGFEEHIRLDLTSLSENICIYNEAFHLLSENVKTWGKDIVTGTSNTIINIIASSLTTTPYVTSTTTTTLPPDFNELTLPPFNFDDSKLYFNNDSLTDVNNTYNTSINANYIKNDISNENIINLLKSNNIKNLSSINQFSINWNDIILNKSKIKLNTSFDFLDILNNINNLINLSNEKYEEINNLLESITTTTTTTPAPTYTTSVTIKYNIDNNITVKLGNKKETLTKGNSTKTVTYTGPEEHIRLDLSSTNTNMYVIDQLNGANVKNWGKYIVLGSSDTKITVISASLTTTTTPDTTPSVTSTTTTTPDTTPDTTPTPSLSPAPVYIASKDGSPIDDIDLTATIWYKGKEPNGEKSIKITSLPYNKSLTEGFAYDYIDTPLTIKFTFSKGILTVNKNDSFEPVTSGKEIIISGPKEFKYTLGPTTPNTNTTPNPTTPNITSTTTTTTTPNPTTPNITSTTTTTTTPNPPLSPPPVYITSKDGSSINDINLTATIWYKGKVPDEKKTIQITSLPYNKSLTEGFAYDYFDTPLTIKFTFSKGILTVRKNDLFEPVTSGKEITISKAKEFKYTLGPTTPNTNTTPNPTTPNITSTTTTTTTTLSF